MKLRYDVDGHSVEIVPLRHQKGAGFSIDGRAYEIASLASDGARQSIEVDGQSYRVVVAEDGGRIFVHAFGRAWEVVPFEAGDGGAAGQGGADHVVAPMPGTVLTISAAEGDVVTEGDAVMVIESMKLETTIRAPRDGRIQSLPLSAGATFDKGTVLVRFDSPAEEADGEGGA